MLSKMLFSYNDEGYVDILFNIIPKEHFIKRLVDMIYQLIIIYHCMKCILVDILI